jgi:hypothetical protein
VNETCGEYGEKRNAYSDLAVTLKGKKPLGRHRFRWKTKTTRNRMRGYEWDTSDSGKG